MDCDHAHLTDDDPVLVAAMCLLPDDQGLRLVVTRCGGLAGRELASAIGAMRLQLGRLEQAALQEGAQLN